VNGLRLLSVGLLVVACGAPQPTLVVPMEIDWEGDFAALIFDSTGLVTGGRYRDAGDGPWPGGAAFARPERNEIDIAWIGGACTHHPTVSLTGTANDLAIKVRTPSDPGPIPFVPIEKDCPLIGLPMGVTLTLSAPVEQQAINAGFSQ
jgi:hypothetical protein